jgi:uncharacterized protein YeaO (DUF488 family)
MIRIKNIYDPKEEQDGLRVLITRFYPRGIKKTHFDIWMKDLAPSQKLLKEFKTTKKTWKQFITNFKSELQRNNDGLQLIKDLKVKTKSKNVTLLCFEKDGTPCHRHLLKKIIQSPKYLKMDFEPNLDD